MMKLSRRLRAGMRPTRGCDQRVWQVVNLPSQVREIAMSSDAQQLRVLRIDAPQTLDSFTRRCAVAVFAEQVAHSGKFRRLPGCASQHALRTVPMTAALAATIARPAIADDFGQNAISEPIGGDVRGIIQLG